ncbi:MAG: hypothetical protein ACOCXJ_03550 [Planctomycetota bacterium]
MFRRQTDQVYEMLQQVQRRMTSPGEHGSSWSSQGSQGRPPTAMPPAPSEPSRPVSPTPVAPQQQASLVQPGTQAPTRGTAPDVPVVDPGSYQEETRTPWNMGPVGGSQVHGSPATAATQRQVRGIGIPVASVLALFWILTVVVAYLVGQSHGSQAPGIPSAGLAPGEAGQRPVVVEIGERDTPSAGGGRSAPPVDSGPSDFLILKSVGSYSDAVLQRWQAEADRLNEIGRQDPDNRLPPLFGVRKPRSGGLQLVYGYRNGRFGIDREQYEEQAAMLREARYKDARWFSPQ